jgi:hypothetical protein
VKPRIEPCPSPTGRNAERLFVYHCPAGSSPELALDAALRKARDKARGRDDGPDLGELRAALAHYLNQLPEDCRGGAMDILDQYLPEREQREPRGKMYGEETDDADPESLQGSLRPKYPDHADDDLEEMPRSPIEDRRGGRDRRRGAMDRQLSAADSFEAMFGAGRIKSAVSFR